jgi:uncharacterized 2Fe-2S/4Fe-4S cluster protein (DUF4445 family)
MIKRSVLFLPDGITVEVEPGTTVLTAAGQANLEIKAPCGGDGTCGKCAILLKSGKANQREGSSLAARLQDQGLSLACQTIIEEEDLVVEIPKSSRLNKHQVLLDQNGQDKSGDHAPQELLHGYPLNPLCKKIHLTLPAPNLQDNRDDANRLLVALRKETKCENITLSLPIVRELAETIRSDHFKLTVYMVEMDGKGEVLAIEPGHSHQPLYGLAVDIGTTTVAIYLLDLETGRLVDTAGTHNSQARYGDDVISRIVHTVEEQDGLHQLHQAIVDTVNQLIQTLLDKQKEVSEKDIRVVMTAGNTTMAHLFLGIAPKYIRLEPYIPVTNFFPTIKAQELGLKINPEATVFSFPAVASYVGGDIVSGALMTNLAKSEVGMSLLIDIGTNGEMVLGIGDSLVTCSCSAGPAFEGSGISYGMRAMQGAIERVDIDKETYEVSYVTIEDSSAVGICGSGLIDCLAKMRNTGIIDRGGHFQTKLPTPRMRVGDGGPEFVLAWEDETELDSDIVITESDVKNLLRAKGAVFAGIRTLLITLGLEVEDIEKIYVAGGFGNYLNIRDAVVIGLLPDLPLERYQFIGNSSVKGACMSLLSQQAWVEAQDLAGKMTYIELSVGNLFMDEFISSLFIPHTDLSLFPSVEC